jgi:hypothetical protein
LAREQWSQKRRDVIKIIAWGEHRHNTKAAGNAINLFLGLACWYRCDTHSLCGLRQKRYQTTTGQCTVGTGNNRIRIATVLN